MYPVAEEWKTYHHLRSRLKWGEKPESKCQFTENGGQSNKLNDNDRTTMDKAYTAGNYVTITWILKNIDCKEKDREGDPEAKPPEKRA